MKVNRREFLTYSGLVGGATAFYGVPLIAQSVARRTDFLPSVHAWRFSNFGGFGNCGGMCWTALDCFYLKQTAPVNLPVPTPALRDRIERRQKDTMDDFLWAKVVEWTALPDIGHPQLPHSVTYRTRHEGWPAVKGRLDHQEPATMVLIREEGIVANSTKNHQVLAYDYKVNTQSNRVSIAVYDSNYPRRDDVIVEFDLQGTYLRGRQLVGGTPINKRMRGFFLVPYDKIINVHLHDINIDGTVGKRCDQRTWRSGWTNAQFYRVHGILFLFLLKKQNGIVHIHRMNTDGTVGPRIKDYNWSEGWTNVEFCQIGAQTFLFLLKTQNGIVHIHRMNTDGTVGPRIKDYNWSEGWTQAGFFQVGARTFLFLLKKQNGIVHIHRMNADGTVGPRIKDYNWSEGWTKAEFFQVGAQTFLFLLKEQNGIVHIHRMNTDGTVGPRIKDYNWSEGWTQAGFFQVGARTFLFLLKKQNGIVHIHRMNADGTVGPRIKDYNWSEGWTTVEFFGIGDQTRLFLMKDKQTSNSWLDIPYV